MEKGKLSVLHIHALREVTTQNRLLILERQMFHQNATEGKLIMGNKTWDTVELPWKENQKNISCIPSGTYTWQKIIRSSNKQPALYIRDVHNSMGISTATHAEQQDVDVNALPFAHYQFIYNEYFRDQNLVDEKNYQLTDGLNAAGDLLNKRRVAWQHDRFTSSLPFTQKGPEVTLPVVAGDIGLTQLRDLNKRLKAILTIPCGI